MTVSADYEDDSQVQLKSGNPATELDGVDPVQALFVTDREEADKIAAEEEFARLKAERLAAEQEAA